MLACSVPVRSRERLAQGGEEMGQREREPDRQRRETTRRETDRKDRERKTTKTDRQT